MMANQITGIIVDACIKIHSAIGPGCFEKVYEECLYYELVQRGLEVKRQMLRPITYEELSVEDAYKLDLLVEDKVIVELKTSYELNAVHFKQITTYLKLLNIKNGLLINFKTNLMKDGIHRVFNNKEEE